MGKYDMIAFIVLVVTVGSVLSAAFGLRNYRRGLGRHGDSPPRDDAETVRLREEVKQLKEGLHVLERIAVEKESSLEREFARLRDQ